jgi:hypothetical protein
MQRNVTIVLASSMINMCLQQTQCSTLGTELILGSEGSGGYIV